MTASESKCKVILPPEKFDFKQPPEPPVVFLAGSIDQGEAPRWDLEVIDSLNDVPCVILNPRRKDWDKSWKQDIENDKFRVRLLETDDSLKPGSAHYHLARIAVVNLDWVDRQPIVLICFRFVYHRLKRSGFKFNIIVQNQHSVGIALHFLTRK